MSQNTQSAPLSIGELEALKSDLINDKTTRTARIAEINVMLKTRLPGSSAKALMQERSELVAANAITDSELRDTNEDLRTIARAGTGDGKAKPYANLGLIVTLVASYRAAGSTDTAEALTARAFAELAQIRGTFEYYMETPKNLEA